MGIIKQLQIEEAERENEERKHRTHCPRCGKKYTQSDLDFVFDTEFDWCFDCHVSDSR